MELEGFSVSGYRCLAHTSEIPVRKRTVLTGANDAGKTTALQALHFLLGGREPGLGDRTIARVDDVDPPGGIDEDRYEEIRVTGRFSETALDSASADVETVLLRRCLRGGRAIYETKTGVCSDPSLRDLDQKSLDELRTLVEQYGLQVRGHGGRRATYLEPLAAYAATLPIIDEWVVASAQAVAQLPRLMVFQNDDPEATIRQALMSVYRAALDDPSITTQLADVEEATRRILIAEAENLRSHLERRCPELAEVHIEPEVSFRDQFPAVAITAGNLPGELVSLSASGAGRRQRISLATWEFAQQLLERDASTSSVVICYDEPDTHLDYGHQRDLAELIRQQATLPGARVIVATHALNLIDKVPVEDVVHLVHLNGRSHVEVLLDEGHHETDQFLAEVAAALGLRTSVLLHERCFIGVEGVTEAQALPIMFRKAMGIPLQSAGLALVAASGNIGALSLARHLVEHGRRVRIIVDEDTFTARSSKRVFRERALRNSGIEPSHVFRVGTRELEDLFADRQWADTANDYWPREDGRQWCENDIAACRAESKFSEALRSMILGAAPSTAPEEKPSYLLALAHRIESREEVPTRLREIFSELVAAAS